jgi:hypothetical protein
MNRLCFLLLSLFILSCNDKEDLPVKQPSHPVMKYNDLTGREVKNRQSQVLDADNDGVIDFVFYVINIGDPVFRRDKMRFLFGSLEHSLLFVNGENQSPVLDKNALISSGNKLPYEWWEVSEVELTQKIIEEDGSTFWEGAWQNADHKYISIQVRKNNAIYNGWIEFSFNKTDEKLVLHRSGISEEAQKEVKAGF